MNRQAVLLLLASVVVLAAAGQAFDRQQDFAAVRESLEHVPRKRWAWWLEDHGYDASRFTTYQRPEATGLRLVGKWGRGPAVEVTGKDTLVALTLGSEVAMLSFADPDRPRVLSEIQLDYLPRQTQFMDSLLLTGGNGIQVWNISDPTRPVQRGVIPYAISDFAVQDSFVYFVSLDTFFVYCCSDPADPRRVGCYRDSGYVATVSGNTAALVFRNFMGFVDVSNPTLPRRVGTYPGWVFSAQIRGNLCCATFADVNNQERSWFLTLDITDPANPRQLGRLDTVCGYDIHLAESLAFVSGRSDAFEEMRIVSIADSTAPRKLGTCGVWNNNWGVWASLVQQRAYIAAEPSGLAVVDIADPSAPQVVDRIMTADQAVDIWVEGNLGYVANYRAGLRILDLTDPTTPKELGGLDSVRTFCETVVSSDSFAFVSWPQPPLFRSILVSDPTRPTPVGGFDPNTDPKDMVLRDTLVYLVGRLRFNVVNVARPRSPVLVGSCVTQDGTRFGLAVQDSFAYLMSGWLQIINVARPATPVVISTNSVGGATGVAVRDTFVYVPYGYDTLRVFSVSDPLAPRLLGYAPLQTHAWDVALAESMAAVATFNGLELFSLGNPSQPQWQGAVATPYGPRRVVYSAPFFYTVMWDAGVGIYAMESTGINEETRLPVRCRTRVTLAPNPATDWCVLTADGVLGGWVVIRDVAGRALATRRLRPDTERRARMNLSGLATGVYFLEVRTESGIAGVKLVKQ